VSTVVVLHRVRDYTKWRDVYDSVELLRKESGVIEHAVFRAEGDPDNVLVTHRFPSLEAAHNYFENPKVLEAVREAGVIESTTRVEFYEDA
jgi:quinol monooxygenase YgiN